MDFTPGNASFFDSLGQREGVFWVDNTRYIAEIEKTQANAFVWLRPRRFGKSLFLNTLDAYYNVLYKNDFEKNFGHLWIGKHRTQDQGSYHVLQIDFGSLDITSLDSFRKSFNELINTSIEAFQIYGIKTEILRDDAISSLRKVFNVITQQKKKVRHNKKFFFSFSLLIEEFFQGFSFD